MKTPQQIVNDFISQWEGGLSLDTTDKGNYVNGKLIGSKYGVTGNALAIHRHIAPSLVTREMMANLTKDEAVAIGVENYYHGYRVNLLPWGHIAAILLDFVWASGSNGVKVFQRTLGVTPDGIIGRNTVAALTKELEEYSEVGFANKFIDHRISYIESLADFKTYGGGWTRRITAMRPSTAWWKDFDNA